MGPGAAPYVATVRMAQVVAIGCGVRRHVAVSWCRATRLAHVSAHQRMAVLRPAASRVLCLGEVWQGASGAMSTLAIRLQGQYTHPAGRYASVPHFLTCHALTLPGGSSHATFGAALRSSMTTWQSRSATTRIVTRTNIKTQTFKRTTVRTVRHPPPPSSRSRPPSRASALFRTSPRRQRYNTSPRCGACRPGRFSWWATRSRTTS